MNSSTKTCTNITRISRRAHSLSRNRIYGKHSVRSAMRKHFPHSRCAKMIGYCKNEICNHKISSPINEPKRELLFVRFFEFTPRYPSQLIVCCNDLDRFRNKIAVSTENICSTNPPNASKRRKDVKHSGFLFLLRTHLFQSRNPFAIRQPPFLK